MPAAQHLHHSSATSWPLELPSATCIASLLHSVPLGFLHYSATSASFQLPPLCLGHLYSFPPTSPPPPLHFSYFYYSSSRRDQLLSHPRCLLVPSATPPHYFLATSLLAHFSLSGATLPCPWTPSSPLLWGQAQGSSTGAAFGIPALDMPHMWCKH